MKKIVCCLIVIVIVFSVFCTAAGAADSNRDKTYNYVALGDSVTAGYGLQNDSEVYINDPALLLTEDLIANPVSTAYPALFGNYVASWGEKNGYSVSTANLASSAYRAEDVYKTILEEGYKSEIASNLFKSGGRDDADAALEKYHDIYNKYLKDADLVSIQLGANDIIVNMLSPILADNNPILSAICLTLEKIFIGTDEKTALDLGLNYLSENSRYITKESVSEAIEFVKNFNINALKLADKAGENVANVIDAVKTVNPDADIVVLNYCNPYGNSLEYEGKVRSFKTVLTDIIVKSEEYLAQKETEGIDTEAVCAVVKEELSYPLQYLLMGSTIEGIVSALNSNLYDVAQSKGAEFIDTFNISNENNLDPHVDAKGHSEIADLMKDALYNKVNAAMGGETKGTSADVTVKKISNPDRGEREVDGLIEGGDRENSYTWRLAMRDDEIYIATTRNIASALVNMYGSEFAKAGISLDTFWALIDVVTNGDIPRNDVSEGANIISYNRKTGEFKVIYTADPGDYYRMAVTFGNDVYFGSYSANPANAQYILKLDSDGKFTKVFETMNSVSLRANCVYDDHLFFAGADDRTPVLEGEREPVAKMAVLRKSNEDDKVWERVADFRDFGLTAYDPIHESWAGAPVWELANHDGYIYATAPTHSGFVIYKGHPAAEGETANEYGWYWQEVAGPTNGINNPGLSDVEGGEPGTMRSLIGSVYEFNGELYAYNFDHSFGGEASAFAGMLQQIAGKEVKASEYLFYLYDSLHNPQKVWKLNDQTGKFEELTAFTELMEGTTNEYVWRMGQYKGELYISTMDAGIFYNYLTQLTNGSFFTMTMEERMQKIGYINDLISLIGNSKGSEALENLKTKLELLKTLLEEYDFEGKFSEKTAEYLLKFESVAAYINTIIDQINSQFAANSVNENNSIASTGAVYDTAATEFAFDMISKSDWKELLGLDDNTDINDADLQELENLITDSDPDIDLSIVINSIDWDKVKADAIEMIRTKLEELKAEVKEIIDKIDIKGIQMYLYINNAVMNDNWGFDLLRSTDGGESFEVITDNGFNDKYNYGCSAFLETDEGLYFGTCNPFYGGQLYLLTTDESGNEEKDVVILGDVDGDGKVTIVDVTYIQQWLAKIELPFEFNETAADVDGDGKVTIVDVSIIQQYLAKIYTVEGIGEPIK